MDNDKYEKLSKHPFVEMVFSHALGIAKEIKKPNGLKVEAEFLRDPIENEFYVLQVGYCLSHLLNTIQQMEHTVLYMSNFSPTEVMKNAGVNRSTHLLWSVENYIIRTQTAYDRLLILTDRLFHIHNAPNRITHDSIVTNTHIKQTNIPNLLKLVKKTVKKYYYDRNTIIHESAYADDELNRIEGLTILSFNSDYGVTTINNLKEDLKYEVRGYVAERKKEYNKINKNLCLALSEVFTGMQPLFDKKFSELCKK